MTEFLWSFLIGFVILSFMFPGLFWCWLQVMKWFDEDLYQYQVDGFIRLIHYRFHLPSFDLGTRLIDKNPESTITDHGWVVYAPDTDTYLHYIIDDSGSMEFSWYDTPYTILFTGTGELRYSSLEQVKDFCNEYCVMLRMFARVREHSILFGMVTWRTTHLDVDHLDNVVNLHEHLEKLEAV